VNQRDRPHNPKVAGCPLSPQDPPNRAGSSPPPLLASERVSDQPEHGRPQSNEECPALRIAPFVLTYRLCAHPEGDANPDAADGKRVEMLASGSPLVEVQPEHALILPDRALGAECRVVKGVEGRGWHAPNRWTALVDRRSVADRGRDCLMALSVERHSRAPVGNDRHVAHRCTAGSA
jgi:hypothetical protein